MLHAGCTQTELWIDLLKEGQKRSHVTLSEDEESYLCMMLQRFVRNADITATVLAIEYLESQNKGRAERRAMLSQVADIGLLLAGLFPERATRKNVSVSYFTTMSQACFFELSGVCEAMRQLALARQYHNIGNAVEKLAYVLYCMRRRNTTVRELLPILGTR